MGRGKVSKVLLVSNEMAAKRKSTATLIVAKFSVARPAVLINGKQ